MTAPDEASETGSDGTGSGRTGAVRLDRRRRIEAYGVAERSGALLLVGTALPGEPVRHGENPYTTVARAMREQTGLEPEITGLRGVVTVVEVGGTAIVHHDRIALDVRVPDREPERGRWAPASAADGWVRALVDGVSPEVPELPPSHPLPAPADRVQRFTAYGLVTDPAGRILLTRIADGYPGAGTWHLPGGGTDFGEAPTEALDREIREETGQVPQIGALIAIAHTHNPTAYGPEQRPIDWHTVRTIFRAHVIRPTAPTVHDQGGSTDQAAWFTRSELRGLTTNRFTRGVIGEYAQ